MQNILVFGSGNSAASLTTYLMREAAFNNWLITVAEIPPVTTPVITNPPSHLQTISISFYNEEERRQLVAAADMVISLLPAPLLPFLVNDCLQLNKHLLTPAGIDDTLAGLHPAIKQQHCYSSVKWGSTRVSII